jgi:WD40 repeat protein/serine/threonine protein kinase
MGVDLTPDEEQFRRLPLPLAQLLRRAHNAKSAADRHGAAYFLWEAGLKLLAAAAVAEFARRPAPDPPLAEKLQNLARPSLGHWWELTRLLVPRLAEGDAGFAAARDLLFGRARDDLPRAAGLDAALRGAADGRPGARSTVRLSELFDRLVAYRNREIGHGAPGQRPAAFYEDLGRALAAGVAELFGRLDVLAGRRLVYVAEVRQAGGAWLAQRYELGGESARRLPSLELALSDTARLPCAERLYLAGSDDGPDGLTPLHPLLAYDAEAGRCLFLNARRGERRLEYLDYTSGGHAGLPDRGDELRALLGRLLGEPVGPGQAEAWAARSVAEEPADRSDGEAGRRTLGEFELLSELGRGGMGVVYRAWQPSLGRQVALKCLLGAGDAKAEARFAREIRALGRVEHPNLVKVFTSGSDGDRWFYAMELVEGAPLSAVCERLARAAGSASAVGLATWRQAVSTACEEGRRAERPLSDSPPPAPPPLDPENGQAPAGGRGYVRHVAGLVRQVAQAAHALHEAGVVHRDVKPGNVLVTADGAQAVLADLGLAQLADEEEGRLTRTRQFVGTLRYASPQQVLAAGRLDRRADVYSLGATLWELLALRPLFGATDQTPAPELMEKVQREEPGRLRALNPAVGRDLEAVAHRCLEKDPAKRYATAQELADDLGRYLAGEPVRARPVRGVERGLKWVRRRPTTASLVAAIVLLTAVGFGLVTWKWRQAAAALEAVETARSAESAAVAQAAREQTEKEAAARLAEVRRRDEYVGSLARVEREWQAGDPGRALALLNSCPADLRGWEWGALRRRMRQERLTVRADPGQLGALTVSPDGRLVAAGTGDVMDPELAGRPGVVQVCEAGGAGRKYTLTGGHRYPVTAVAFHPAGGLLASVSCFRDYEKLLRATDLESCNHADGELVVWDLTRREAVRTYPGFYGSLAFSPDGSRLAAANPDGGVTVFDTTGPDWKALRTVATGPGLVEALAFGPGGKTLAVSRVHVTGFVDGRVQYTTDVSLWDTDTALWVRPALDWAEGEPSALAFSPDGRLLAAGGSHQVVVVWEAATGRRLHVLSGHANSITSLAFGPGGRWLASAGRDRLVRLWDPATGRRLAELRGHTDTVTGLGFLPDGPGAAWRLVSAGRDGSLRFWDEASAADGLELGGYRSAVTNFAFSPDGRLAARDGSGVVKVWDPASGQGLLAIPTHGEILAFRPDGRRLVTGGGDPFHPEKPGELVVWDAATGAEVRRLEGPSLYVSAVAFTPDGRRLLAASGNPKAKPPKSGEVTVYDTATWAVVATFHSDLGLIDALAFRPDGSLLAVGAWNNRIQLCDPATGAVVRSLTGHRNWVSALAFSPDGRELASTDFDGTVAFWDPDTGERRRAWRAHPTAAFGLSYHPSGRRLATASIDSSNYRSEVKIWDPSDGRELLTLPGQMAVAFGPDGRRLAAPAAGSLVLTHSVRVWDALPPEPPARPAGGGH